MQRIHLISTGGTIEKIYSETTGSVVNLESKIDRYLKQLRLPDAEIDAISVMNIDSLEMTHQDREEGARSRSPAPRCPHRHHPWHRHYGRDRSVPQAAPASLTVPIIFTGAMTPLGFERSDGLQNLTESLLAARLLPPGIWLVIHNQVFPIDQVRKDRENARFVSTCVT